MALQPELEARYEQYCLEQARGLLHLIPRDAVRPMLRAARCAGGSDAPGTGEEDPFGLLVEHARALLPLPPFEVWLADFVRAPLEHVEASFRTGGPGASAPLRPVALDTRNVDLGTEIWLAVLMVFPDSSGSTWRGFVSFGERPGRLVHRTADIFLDVELRSIRDRFREMDSTALLSLLRSSAD